MTGPNTHQLLQAGLDHHKAGRLREAESAYRQILSLQSDHPDALHLLGVLIHQAGRADEAAGLIHRAIALRPDQAVFHNNLSLVLSTQEKWEQAIESCRRAIALNPSYAEGHHNLGNTLMRVNRFAEAADALRRAVALRPDHADAWFNLGVALCKIGPLDEGITSCRRAVDLRPDRGEGWCNLGVALLKSGRHPEAETCYREALRRNPDNASALHKLAGLLMMTSRLDEAEAACQRSIELQPQRPEALGTLANILKDQGRIDEAIAGYRRSLMASPKAYPDYGSLLYAMHFHPGYDTRSIYHEHCLWNAVQAMPLEREKKSHTNDRSPERRLRIGYVSPHFRNQATSFFTMPLLGGHDSSQVEVYCYADVLRRDEITAMLQKHAAVWRDIVGLPDERVAQMIRDDGIDILIDLTMHMAEGRPFLFARKPAPVQVAWLAYPGTTGLTTMDYRLTDPILDPFGAAQGGPFGGAQGGPFDGAQGGPFDGTQGVPFGAAQGGPIDGAQEMPPGANDAHYSEISYRLPDAHLCYNPLTAELAVNSLPALRNGRVTFGSLNHFAKVNDTVMKMWAAALAAVPDSRMLVLAPRGSHRQRLEDALRASGADPRQIEYLERQPRPQYLEFYHRIDIVLDTYPYNGETTSLDGLWMGVPMVTLCGSTAPSRAGLCYLSHLGLADLVAKTPAEFAQVAARVVGDLPRLAELRGALRARMEASPLMDARRFARNMEAAYRWMWRRWCASPRGT